MALILSALAGLGINFVKDLIADHGETLVAKGIEKVTGIDVTKKELTQEDKQRIVDAEIQIKQLDFKKLELELESKKESNRHEEKYEELKVGDKQNARGAEHLAPLQTVIATEVYAQTKWQIPILLIANVLLVICTRELDLDPTVVVAAGNLIGIALNNAFRERQSLLEFLFGSSVGSKTKDKL